MHIPSRTRNRTCDTPARTRAIHGPHLGTIQGANSACICSSNFRWWRDFCKSVSAAVRAAVLAACFSCSWERARKARNGDAGGSSKIKSLEMRCSGDLCASIKVKCEEPNKLPPFFSHNCHTWRSRTSSRVSSAAPSLKTSGNIIDSKGRMTCECPGSKYCRDTTWKKSNVTHVTCFLKATHLMLKVPGDGITSGNVPSKKGRG